MADYPLLIFPKPTHAERARRHGGGGKIQVPKTSQQAKRLEPQFKRLQQYMNQKRLTLQDNPLGLQPEQVLVIETFGPIQNFIKAVKKVEGLEWFGEFELDDISPDHGFEYEQPPKKHLQEQLFNDGKTPQKQLKGQLFLVMTDQRALQELQSLFIGWKKNPDTKFPMNLAPLKHAFVHLNTIRPWNTEDRISETGLFKDWEDRLQEGQELVPFEAELWFRGKQDQRQRAESDLRNIIQNLDGEFVQQCIIPDIAYHGILGKIPADRSREIIARQEVRLLECEGIMYLRPVGQCAIHVPMDMTETDSIEKERQPDLPQGEPIVALFDGLPLTGHQLLNGRLIIDDPDGFESDYQAHERVHGTAMASLICHGDLNEDNKPLDRPVYVRPIMKPKRFSGKFMREEIPSDILPIDLIHRAVRRLYKPEGDEPPVAPSVRVISLSVCDESRPFDREISSWARLLDWLSSEYNILFMVSAGNYNRDIELNILRSDLIHLTAEERQKAVIQTIAEDTRHRRLLSPAETFNGITVAATHTDVSTPKGYPKLIDPFAQMGLPSTYSAQGPGYQRAVKPDIFFPGGRQFFREKLINDNSNATLETAPSYNRPPGQYVARLGVSGELNRGQYMIGTSNATALASRGVNLLYGVIDQLRAQSGTNLSSEYDAVLLKALLVHGADWGDAGLLYEEILKNSKNRRALKEYLGRFLGYGTANIAKVRTCTDQRVTVLGVGKLDDGDGHIFSLPFPPSLSTIQERRRLTVTLAWLTPINSMHQNYRVAHLWFDPKNKIAPERIGVDYRTAQRGTLQHDVLEGEKATDFQDGDTMEIKINCRADGGDITKPIQYGLAVTLEVAEEVDIPIYQEVSERLGIRVPVRDSDLT